MESLAQFFARKGLHKDSSPEEVVKARKEYRDQYMKQKQKEFRETHIRKEIYLTKREFGYLKHAAEKHQMKLSRFIKNLPLPISNRNSFSRTTRTSETWK